MTKALTLTQPWATLVALGIKHVETRSWSTRYRGPLLIHAAKGSPDRDLERRLKQRWVMPTEGPLPLGAIVARCELVDVRPTSDRTLIDSITDLEEELGDFSPDRFGWILERVELVDPPIPWTGALGLWDGPTLEAWRRARADASISGSHDA